MLLNFVFGCHGDGPHGFEKVELVVLLLADCHRRRNEVMGADQNGDKALGQDCIAVRELYDAVTLISLARILQNSSSRSSARLFLSALPSVPFPCLRLLRLLLHMGRVKVGPGAHHRGVRAEALSLLLHSVRSSDRRTGKLALNMLLWSCLSEDFETRNKAILSLMR